MSILNPTKREEVFLAFVVALSVVDLCNKSMCFRKQKEPNERGYIKKLTFLRAHLLTTDSGAHTFREVKIRSSSILFGFCSILF